jgi:hypothetical protein
MDGILFSWLTWFPEKSGGYGIMKHNKQWFEIAGFFIQAVEIVKVLYFLEACFDLISGSSLHMKIQIMGGKITENEKKQARKGFRPPSAMLGFK